MTFGERLKDLRKKRSLTQSQLGEKLNVTKASISGYENDTRSPDRETLVKIAEIFNVSTDYLLGRTDDKDKGPTLVAAHLDDDLTEEQLDEVKNFIDFIKQRDHSGK
ncbi:helix-turn-helix domain-containing protein [Enterococcus asini]|uniref:helix-turn-helix domain-containing protein n=1 Tax=Enterococcus asini TaxID=57732 RepID=UPI001E50CA12|nr:helix-turn-helix transcriptional regulator [Enterococcus asini]MCD5029078.1 helix-turn-helix transcriptional regulator [Enterococcus asini]